MMIMTIILIAHVQVSIAEGAYMKHDHTWHNQELMDRFK
jgi:hypothetical protein